jgi:isoquinoline 1-oxidoreductase beta subunit
VAPARTYSSNSIAEDYRAIARDVSQSGVAMFERGDAAAAIKGAAKVLAADYFSDHVSHGLYGADERDGYSHW